MRRVVVVDDEPEFREWLSSLLNASQDYEVVGEAASGIEALSLIGVVIPDLVIIDEYIPEPDGLEVIRYIREHFPDIETILVSAYHEPVYARLAKEEGALAFIPKIDLSLDLLSRILQMK
jgi:YesN/AraC family two-component response regulator